MSAFIKALGAVLASIALLAELKAVRALSAAGTACRTHTVGAEMAVRANLIPAVEAVLAAVLADGRTGGTAIAADTGRRTGAASVAVAAPGFVVAVAALADSAVGAKGIIAVAAMLAAVPADRCTILAAVAADTGVHAAAAGDAVVAPAVVLHALLAAAAVSAEIAIAVLAMLSAFRTHLTALFAGLPTDTDNGTGVTTSAALTVFIRAVGTHTALGTEFIPAVAAALTAVRAEIRAFLAAVAAEAGIRTSAALGAPTVALHARLAFHAVFAENIAVCAVALTFLTDDETVAASAVASLTDQIGAVATGVAALAPVVRAFGADLSALVAKRGVTSAASGAAILTAAAAKRKVGVEFALVRLCTDLAAVFADDFSAAQAAVAAFAAVAGRLHADRAKLTLRTGVACFTGGAGCPAKRADPFHAIGAMLRAAFADSGTVAAQITVGAPVVARADRSAVVAKVICTHAFVAGTAVVVLIAAPAALSRAVIAALAAVTDVVIGNECIAEFALGGSIPCVDGQYDLTEDMFMIMVMLLQAGQRDHPEKKLQTQEHG